MFSYKRRKYTQNTVAPLGVGDTITCFCFCFLSSFCICSCSREPAQLLGVPTLAPMSRQCPALSLLADTGSPAWLLAPVIILLPCGGPLWPIPSDFMSQEGGQLDLAVHGGREAGPTVHGCAPVHSDHRGTVAAQSQAAFQNLLVLVQL